MRRRCYWTTHDGRGQTIGHMSDSGDLIMKQRLSWTISWNSTFGMPCTVSPNYCCQIYYSICTLCLLGLFLLLASSVRCTYWSKSLKYSMFLYPIPSTRKYMVVDLWIYTLSSYLCTGFPCTSKSSYAKTCKEK